MKETYVRLDSLPHEVDLKPRLNIEYTLLKDKFGRDRHYLGFKGVLTKDEKDELLGLSSDRDYREAVQVLYRGSNADYRATVKHYAKAFGLCLLLLSWGAESFFVESLNKEIHALNRKKEDLHNACSMLYFHSPAVDVISVGTKICEILYNSMSKNGKDNIRYTRAELYEILKNHRAEQNNCLVDEVVPLLPKDRTDNLKEYLKNLNGNLEPKSPLGFHKTQEQLKNKLSPIIQDYKETLTKKINDTDTSLEWWRDKAKRLHILGTLLLVFGIL